MPVAVCAKPGGAPFESTPKYGAVHQGKRREENGTRSPSRGRGGRATNPPSHRDYRKRSAKFSLSRQTGMWTKFRTWYWRHADAYTWTKFQTWYWRHADAYTWKICAQRPGSATASQPVDTIDCPTVQLHCSIVNGINRVPAASATWFLLATASLLLSLLTMVGGKMTLL